MPYLLLRRRGQQQFTPLVHIGDIALWLFSSIVRFTGIQSGELVGKNMRSKSLASTVGLSSRPKTAEELEDVIPWGVWKATFLICTQSFTYGYILSSLNSTLQFGDDHNGTYCNRGQDSTCDRGSVYKDINLSDGKRSIFVVFGRLF